jgi:hypothetical protein
MHANFFNDPDSYLVLILDTKKVFCLLIRNIRLVKVSITLQLRLMQIKATLR